MIIFLILALFTGQAFAADLIVTVPKSGITIPQPEPARLKAESYLELNQSTWEPKGISMFSRISGTSKFQKRNSNRTSLNFGMGEWNSRIGFLSPKIGFSHMTLERSGTLGFANSGYTVVQDMAYYQGRLGIEWTSHNDLLANLRPFAGVAALPVWMMSSASQFDNGVNEFRWMGEATIGFTYNLKFVSDAIGLNLTGVSIGYETTEGLSPDELAGNGVTLGARISWN